MTKLKVEQFVDVVKRSGLVDDERLNQVLSGVDQSVKDSGIIASNLTKAGLLTEWQSEKLLQGKHKGFYLGKYKLLNHIGTGGMGAVYLGEHQVMRHRVAIKLLPNHLAQHSSYLERFHQEARASAALVHPNIIRAYDVDQQDNLHYLVMEYVEGVDVQGIVSRNGPLPYRTAASYIKQAADGLAYAHQVGLIHRDIKPANLLVDAAGTLKILDMGLARFEDESQASLTREYDQKMIGTVDYLAPEQALDSHKVDGRADIYSLGCTLYFTLVGDAPFAQGTISQRLLQHQSAEPTDIRQVRPDVPDALVAICRKMMAKSLTDRYQTAGEVANDLAKWLDDGTGPTNSYSGNSYGGGNFGGNGTNSYNADAPAGPSLNENLMLAPLDDEPASRNRTATPANDSAAKEASSSDVTSKSNVKQPGQSGVTQSGVGKKSGANKIVTAGQKPPSGVEQKSPSGVGQTGKKPKSGITSPAPIPTLEQGSDLMDDLLSAPSLGHSESIPSSTLAPMHRSQQKKSVFSSVGLVIALGVGGALVLVVVLLILNTVFSKL